MRTEPLTVDEVAAVLRTGRDGVIYAIETRRLRANRGPRPGDRTPYEIRRAEVLRLLADTAEPKRPAMTELPKLPKLYTLAEVAAESRLPLSWLKEQVRRKTLPHLRPGRKPLMTVEDVAAAIKAYTSLRPVASDVQAELDRRRNRRPTKRAA